MTGLDLRVQNFLKFFLAFLGASTDDLGLQRFSYQLLAAVGVYLR
jgi:hypothetical protein